MPRSVKNAKVHSSKKPKVKHQTKISKSRKQYSSDAVDYRFGVLGDFKFHGKTFSAAELVDVCLNQMFMRAVLVPHASQTTPKLIVIPDHASSVKSVMSELDRHQVYFLPFSAFLSLLMHKNQIELLTSLGFDHAAAEKHTTKLPAFCLSGSVHFHGLFLSHRFIRDRFTRMGFDVNQECSSSNKKAVVVGDVEHASKYGEHVSHLTVPEFFALQPSADLQRLHNVMLDALNALPLARSEDSTEVSRTMKTSSTGSKKHATAKKGSTKKPTKKKKQIRGGSMDEIAEEIVQNEEEPIMNEDDEIVGNVKKQKKVLLNKKGKKIGRETSVEVDIESDNNDNYDNDDEPVAWVL